MSESTHKRLDLEAPPTEAELEELLADGWRLISVVPYEGKFTALFERAYLGEAHSVVLSKAVHDRIAHTLSQGGRTPELQRLADGIGHLQQTFFEILKNRVGDDELQRLATDDPGLAELIADLRRVGGAPSDAG